MPATTTHPAARVFTMHCVNHGRRNAITSIADGTKAERARNTEIGFNYNNGSFAANGSYFWQKIKDAVAGPQQRHDAAGNPIAGVREIVNAGYIKNQGYELGASYRTGGLMAKVGVSTANRASTILILKTC